MTKSRDSRGKPHVLVSSIARGKDGIQLIGGLFLIAAIFIGPLLAGSYYGAWRWPLVYTSSIAALMLICGSRWQPASKPGNHGARLLLGLLVLSALQGVWMWFNAWGVFYNSAEYYDVASLPWRIDTLAGQPFPSLPGTADRAEAYDRLSYILPCLALVWGVRQLVVFRPSWCQHLAKSIFWSGAIIALIGVLQRASGTSSILWLDQLEQGLLTKHFFATYRSPGIATCFLNVALALGLPSVLNALRSDLDARGFRAHYPMAYLLITIAAVIIIICAVITAGSKAGMAFGVITIILFCLLNRHAIGKAFRESSTQLFFGNKPIERNIFIGAIICITVFLILSFAGIMSERWSGAHKLNYSSLTGRLQANEVMLKMVADDGWGALGMGPGSFYPLFPYYSGQIESLVTGIWVYAHNDYMQTLVEWGWLGTSVLAACIGGGFLLLARELFFHRNDHSKKRFIHLRGYLLAMSIFLVHALIEFPFQIESLAVVFSIMLGVAWASPALRGRDIRKKDRYGRTRRSRHNRPSRKSRKSRPRHGEDSAYPA
ncbi:MAG: O-antigen ligase family protein [Akkermansiaceae bacterium]|nr:O-antigen ligase family protein [Akkermansiaceae bacterium]